MARLTYASFALLALAAASCGSKNSSNAPDAKPPIDATPPVDAPPDALVCQAPTMQCTPGVCTNTDTDPMNCGQCNMACTQGGSYCMTGNCACPAGNFLPADISTGAFLAQDFSTFHVLIDGALFAGTNGGDVFVPVVATMGTTTGNFTLKPPSGGALPTPPLILIGYNVNTATMSADAYYAAVSGTMNVSKFTCGASGSELKGTLTNVKFQGATGSLQTMNLMVDPNGCTFTVTSMTFDITSTTACTP
jgi:hypothetical protein